MAEWIEGVKCIHSIGCGLMVSILLSLVIQTHVTYSMSSCDEAGTHLNGTSKCEFTNDRIWTLSLFYSGAAIFLIGSLGTCLSNGYIIIFHIFCVTAWMTVIAGLTVFRMSSHEWEAMDAFQSITVEVIRDNWDVWATIVRWVLGISFIVSMASCLVMVIYFIQYKTL